LAGISRALSCPELRETTAQFRAVENHVDFAPSKLRVRWDAVLRVVCPCIRDHHRPGVVLAVGNHALEVGVFERMVLRARAFRRSLFLPIVFEWHPSHSGICRELHDRPYTISSPHGWSPMSKTFAGRQAVATLQFSRTTSPGLLSSRRPRNRGCRSLPSRVHSVKAIWATSLGFTQ
jgi:hypothetical protein